MTAIVVQVDPLTADRLFPKSCPGEAVGSIRRHGWGFCRTCSGNRLIAPEQSVLSVREPTDATTVIIQVKRVGYGPDYDGPNNREECWLERVGDETATACRSSFDWWKDWDDDLLDKAQSRFLNGSADFVLVLAEPRRYDEPQTDRACPDCSWRNPRKANAPFGCPTCGGWNGVPGTPGNDGRVPLEPLEPGQVGAP